MIPLYSSLPYSVEYGRKVYKLRPYYDRVLEAAATLKRQDISESDALNYSLWLLIDARNYPCSLELLQAVFDTLIEPVKRNDGSPRSIDYEQDAALIYAAFQQAYGIDLREERRLHWWKFQVLLAGLPSNTRLMEIVKIRTMPVPKPTKYNHEQIQEIMRLKALYKIQLTEDEAKEQYSRGLQRLAAQIISG